MIYKLEYSPDGQRLAAFDYMDRSIHVLKVYPLLGLEKTAKSTSKAIWKVDWLSTGQLVTHSEDLVMIWDPEACISVYTCLHI